MLLERNNKSYLLKVLHRAQAKRTNFTRFVHVCTLFVHGLITNCVEHVGINIYGNKTTTIMHVSVKYERAKISQFDNFEASNIVLCILLQSDVCSMTVTITAENNQQYRFNTFSTRCVWDITKYYSLEY